MTETELTFSNYIERFGVTLLLSIVVFLVMASLLDYCVFSIEVSVIISIVLTIPFTAMLVSIPVKNT